MNIMIYFSPVKRQIWHSLTALKHHIKDESGSSLISFFVFILLVSLITFVTIQMIRPSYCSGRFKTALNEIVADSFSKSDQQIMEEILSQAETIGLMLKDEDIAINWGAGRETLEIELAYSFPVDLVIYSYNRQFNYSLSKKLNYPKKMINRTEQKLEGSYHKMVDKARKAEQKLNNYEE